MWVSQLRLSHFRNHTETTLDLTPGVTIFVGDNGQGKTNLVEALGYLSYLSSHRVSADKALVQAGADDATILATVRHQQRAIQLACQLKATGSNLAKLDGNTVALGELTGWLKVVLFTPEDMAMVRGEPALRRRYLDSTLQLTQPSARVVLADYDRVVRQRNALLKSNRGRPTPELQHTLAGFDEAFLSLAADITARRLELLRALQPKVEGAYQVLAQGELVELGLESLENNDAPESLSDFYATQLETRRPDEWERGMTLVGPHRDDLSVVLNGLPARTHSSQGEAWSVALSLRIAQAQLYREDSVSGDPVMVLDDVFAELDRSRRETLQNLVRGYEQVLVTAAVPDDIPAEFADTLHHIVRGKVITDG